MSNQTAEETPKKQHPVLKVILRILLILLAVIALLTAVIAVNASKNSRAMRETVSKGLEELTRHYTVVPLEAGEYADITMNGVMKFHTDQYEVTDLGNLSVMTTNMGFMQMASFVITPYDKAVPLCSMDFMYIMGNRKSYVEFYDLVPDTQTAEYTQVLGTLEGLKERYSHLEELEASENWYDSYLTVVLHKQLRDDTVNQTLFCDAISTYLDAADALGELSPAEAQQQWNNTRQYSSDLVTKGGVSTNVFKSALGEDTTRDFFDKVFFGTAQHAPDAE